MPLPDSEELVQLRSWSVLCIEDDKTAQVLLRKYIGKFFDHITLVETGEEAEKLLKKKKYEIILLDINLPDRNGLDIARKIKSRNPSQLVVVMSGVTEADYFLQAFELSIDGYIAKPFTFSNIEATIMKLAAQKLLEQKVERYQKNLEEQITIKTKQLEYHYITDPVTGLFNRNYFLEKVQESKEFCLLMINLDNFSQVNLGYGLEIGDKILLSAGTYISEQCPENSIVFRLQADEFLVLIENPRKNQEIELAETLVASLQRHSFKVIDIGIKMGATIGVYRGSGEHLLQKASTALLQAREKGRGRYEVYDEKSQINIRQRENVMWIALLKFAIEVDDLIPYFQPIINNENMKVQKYECLIRLMQNGDLIPPAKFLNAAKIAGLLPTITGICVEKTFPLLKGNDIEVSFNITDQDFKGKHLVEYLTRKAEENEIDPTRITLEILEDIEVSSGDDRMYQISALRERGFQIALDDFGVSNSNFARIAEYQPELIKIDGRFIKDIHENKQSYTIAKIITQFGQSIGAKVVAEFVHNEQVLKIVKELGIDFSQGFLLGVPSPDFQLELPELSLT